LASQTDEQLQFKLDFGQFISFVDIEREDVAAKTIALIGYNVEKKETTLYRIVLTDEI